MQVHIQYNVHKLSAAQYQESHRELVSHGSRVRRLKNQGKKREKENGTITCCRVKRSEAAD